MISLEILSKRWSRKKTQLNFLLTYILTKKKTLKFDSYIHKVISSIIVRVSLQAHASDFPTFLAFWSSQCISPQFPWPVRHAISKWRCVPCPPWKVVGMAKKHLELLDEFEINCKDKMQLYFLRHHCLHWVFPENAKRVFCHWYM